MRKDSYRARILQVLPLRVFCAVNRRRFAGGVMHEILYATQNMALDISISAMYNENGNL